MFKHDCYNRKFIYQQIEQNEQDSANVLSANFLSNPSVRRTYFPFRSYEEKNGNFDVAVCAPAFYYYNDDISKQLVEWFTILQALNVSKVFTYTLNVHPNIQKVLNYYEKIGFASITKFTNPSPLFPTSSILR